MRDNEYSLSGASFWTPEHLDDSTWSAHVPFTFWLLDVLRPRLAVGHGSRLDPFFTAFRQAAIRLDLDARAVAISAPHGGKEPSEPQTPAGARAAAAMSELHVATDEAPSHFDRGSVDLLHIPDVGGGEDLGRILDLWESRLSPDAVALVHPIGDPDRLSAQTAWAMVSRGRPCFTFGHAGGLGILCLGPAAPEALRGLMGAGSRERDAVRAFYRALGETVSSRGSERHGGASAVAPLGGRRQGGDADAAARLGRLALAALKRDAEDLRRRIAAHDARAELIEGVLTGRRAGIERDARASRARIDELLRWGVARQARAAELIPALRKEEAGRLTAENRLASLDGSRLVRSALWLSRRLGRGAAEIPKTAPSDERMRRAAAVRATGLFDEAYYLATNPDIAAEGVDAASHFAETGWWEGRRPNPDFDPGFYLAHNPDVAETGANPLVHYAEAGIVEGRRAAPSAEAPRWLRPVGEPVHSVDEAAVEAVLDTNLFDDGFYREQNPDLLAEGIEPVLHFVRDGWREGRRPNPWFDPAFYLAQNPDVVLTGENPLVHYATLGILEGRAPSLEGTQPARRPVRDRRVEAVVATGLFDADFYRAVHPDIDGEADPALHYAVHGWREGRKPNLDFDPQAYLAANPDVAALGTDPLIHFADFGLLEGRPLSPPSEPVALSPYDRWVLSADTLTEGDRRAIRARIERFRARPLISVVMPVYDPPIPFLRDAVASVQRQLYPHWELCIADDASPNPAVRRALRELAADEPRIRLVERPANGHIAAASNSALALATGAFVALMDHDDLIAEQALFEVAAALDADPELDVIYSDEDHVDAHGRRHSPYFKPDFDPDLLLGHNLVSHLGVYRRSLVERIGGFRTGFDGSQDYDLALRAVDEAGPARVRHIPAVLYHWRSGTGVDTFSEASIERCIASARRAIADHLARTGQSGDVVAHPTLPSWHRVARPRPAPAPLVSVIVPTKDGADLLRACAEGVLHGTDYPALELIVVDHQSSAPDALALLDELRSDPRVRVLPHAGPFNYSAINNRAVRHARGSVLALLNNDVEVIGRDWLDEMVAQAVRPEVGAVGAKLLYPDGRVQHGGVVLGMGGVANHLSHGLAGADPGYCGRAVMTASVSAVTGACLVVRRSVFEAAGGFDEANLAVAFNDVDLCLKIRALGYRNLYAAQAVLVHHESVSRGDDLTGAKLERFRGEAEFMRLKWGDDLDRDPAYNPNLTLDRPDSSPAFPPRRRKPWDTQR